jgi:ATP-dependent helicase STH1/SNF2
VLRLLDVHGSASTQGTILGATGDTTEMDEEEKLLVIDRLHQVLRPFLLRRLKSDVEAELKPKIEKVIKCNMSACQWRLYNDIRNRGAIELQPKSDADPSGKKRTTTNIMMELRKACNHPYLFWFDTRPASFCSEIIRCSGKFELLHRILPKFKATGHKVLIFFQMTKVMDIFGDFLQWQGHRYLRLDGNTKSDERAQLIEIFNTPESPFGIFILSTKAGGTAQRN